MIRENPFSTRRFQARAIGRDPRICEKGIMASGTWIRRINRSKTWPHPNAAVKRSSLNLLTERRPDRVESGHSVSVRLTIGSMLEVSSPGSFRGLHIPGDMELRCAERADPSA